MYEQYTVFSNIFSNCFNKQIIEILKNNIYIHINL